MNRECGHGVPWDQPCAGCTTVGAVERIRYGTNLLRSALKDLSFAAQITGGVPGPDPHLQAAIESAGKALAATGCVNSGGTQP